MSQQQLGFNLTPDSPFADPAGQLPIRRASLEAAIAKFQELMAQANSPIRAVHHIPARPAEYADFPAALGQLAPGRWRFCRDFSLHYAEMHAERGNAIAALGQTCRAVLEEAHARCCADGRWVLNEKHLLDAAGLADINDTFLARAVPDAGPTQTVVEVRQRLLEASPS